MDTICGYAVVRLPEHNFDATGRGAFNVSAPRIGEVFYGGFDRMEWFDVDTAFYSGTLPKGLHALRTAAQGDDYTSFRLLTDVGEARALLAFSNARERRNEIITVYGKALAEIKGAISIPSDLHQCLGWDIAGDENWSLLADGLFWRPELFLGYERVLNANGLLSSKSQTGAYVAAYKARAAEGLVEEISGLYPVDAIRVCRVVDSE